MRRYSLSLLTAITAIGLAVSQASAADLPRKAPAYVPPAPPPFSWTGFYIGINGGAGWGTVASDVSNLPAIGGSPGFPLSSHNVNGWLFGGQIGYNWQVNPWLVLGIEGDGDWANLEGTAPCANPGLPIFALSCNSKVKWTADVAGRVGFAVDRALFYVKGGVVWADTEHNFSGRVACCAPGGVGVSATDSETRTGGLFGVGVEYAFLPNWSAKLEYNFMDFGNHTQNFVVTGLPIFIVIPPLNTSISEQVHVIKAGVNYRFDWGRM